MFKIEIDTSNAAFEGNPAHELSRMLAIIARRLSHGERPYEGDGWSLHDVNGNMVGRATLDWEPEEEEY